ncbi:MAG TPA: FAD-binding protein [Kofleriaceae bacterium]|nr:FAD-binding protein [Kofleriaceae bacterium]
MPGLVLALLAALLGAGCAASKPADSRDDAPRCRCVPDQPCWPGEAEWERLRSKLTGTLERPVAPPAGLKNPFEIQELSGGTQSIGWLDAWQAAPSVHAVAAKTAGDVAAAVDFAREHDLRLVIKGTGHDYLGRSSAPDSLLVWTHAMRDITMHDAFVARGCAGTSATPAVSVGAGTRWLEAYQEVTGKHGRYVQGGGCTSVGAAGGFIQGGGFGSWSKKYGTGAANVLEAEVVTAGGEILVANACQNQDLFWALRGGGGGTYGVVTRMTMRTHALPNYFGLILGGIEARSDAAFVELIERFLAFYAEKLNNEHWGEQISVKGNNSIELTVAFQGMSAAEAEKVWQPLRAWVDQRPDRYAMKARFFEIPGKQMWNRKFILEHLPQAIVPDARPDQPGSLFWWASNEDELATFWNAYQSRWIPIELFQPARVEAFASSIFEASRHWSVDLHFNKGQAGASADAVGRLRETSMNPAVLRAAALVIMADNGGRPGNEGERAEAEAERARVSAAMKILRAATPGAGTYVNEADYFEPGWQREFWGENYEKLAAIKRKYDPEGLFYCHHCVGSESWSKGGMCRAAR